MNALQPLESPPTTRRRRRRSPQRLDKSHQSVVAEITVKLVANTILSMAAIAALVKLLPYQLTQQEKLREVRMEVQSTQERVNELRNNFSRNFDPNQTRKVMQEQSPRVDPNQRRIFWVKRTNP